MSILDEYELSPLELLKILQSSDELLDYVTNQKCMRCECSIKEHEQLVFCSECVK